MSRQLIAVTGVCTAGILLAGCAQRSGPTPIQSFVLANRQATLRIAIPAAPRQLDRVPLSVTVTDSKGQPVPEAAVSADLSMPAMPMPANTVRLKNAFAGSYSGNVRFTMPGRWQIAITVRSARTGTMTQSIETTVAQ